MTPEERARFQHIGLILGDNFAVPVLATISFGVATGLFIIWIHLNRGRGFGTLQRKAILATMVTSYLLHAAIFAGCTLTTAVQIKETLINRASAGTVNEATDPYNIVVSWGQQIQLIINDGIVVWRAWVLYPNQKWVMLAPWLLLVATTGCSIPSMIFEVIPGAVLTSNGATEPVVLNLGDSAFILSLATNLVATLLILHRFRVQYSTHRHNLGQRSMTRGQRVLLVLVVSGLTFCALQTTVLAVSFIPISPASDIAYYVLSDCFWSTMPLFSIAVFIIVQTNTLIIETSGFNSAALRGIVADIECAPHGSIAELVPEDSDTVSTGSMNVYPKPPKAPISGVTPLVIETRSAS